MPIEDSEVVRRALEGSEVAYAELLHRYQRPIFSLILRMVRDRPLAEDLAQEVFLKAFGALTSFDPKRKLSSWLFKIAHNATVDYLRKGRLDTVPLETPGEGLDPLSSVGAPEAEGPERFVERGDLARGFERALLELRSDYREVLVLRYQEGLTYEEISEVCDLPLGTVKTHLHRARKALAAQMAEAGWAPSGWKGETLSSRGP